MFLLPNKVASYCFPSRIVPRGRSFSSYVLIKSTKNGTDDTYSYTHTQIYTHINTHKYIYTHAHKVILAHNIRYTRSIVTFSIFKYIEFY